MPPKFITFEGTEGVGKTTAIDGVCRYLSERGIDHIRTREPGGTPFAEELRKILLGNDTDIAIDTELLLIFTARSDHLHKVILPALDAGKWVVCDRFIDSTVAYQGFGRYKGERAALDKIDLLSRTFVSRLPDATFWLDLDIKTGMERVGKRSAADRFEREDLAYFNRVYDGFVYQYTQNPNRIFRIDATGLPHQNVQIITENLTVSGMSI